MIFSSGAARSRVTTSRWGNYRPQYLPLTNRPNPILSDLREYRAERLNMNNPKGWDHVLRAFERIVKHDPWGEVTPAQIDHARRVLTRLASFKKENTP